MSKAISTVKAAVPTKKEARKLISEKIEQALPELKTALGDKKFQHRLKKAVKILSEDFTAVSASASAPKVNETPSSAEPAKQNVPVKKAANAKPVPSAKAKSVKPKAAKAAK
ncbi:hypothetical protein QTN47_03115 [Danxiaibacter flavus]|uniref:Uncharacterized protein n=1 Tax=Danxiaibacter flavus TaxID=3049108 RepID=A0ABV3ZA45_9BACT|nr:hypothetical protein QNM32_03115 [Chitinophagaceae bacterium DXS]